MDPEMFQGSWIPDKRKIMIAIHPEYCPQNHRCPTIPKCPAGAISQNGFSAPTIDQNKCIDCGLCVKACIVFEQTANPA
jgi:ferredoxin